MAAGLPSAVATWKLPMLASKLAKPTQSPGTYDRGVGGRLQLMEVSWLHAFVVGAAAALGGDPVDDLVGVGDVAGFAVDAVCGADLQLGAVFIRHHFVDGGGAKILAGVAVFADAAVAANVRLENDEVAGLVFFVPRAGMIYVGKAIEGELAVTFEARGLVDESAVAI